MMHLESLALVITVRKVLMILQLKDKIIQHQKVVWVLIAPKKVHQKDSSLKILKI